MWMRKGRKSLKPSISRFGARTRRKDKHVNLSPGLPGVFISMLTMVLWCGACSVTPPSGLMPTAGNQGAPGGVIITGITTETLAENVRIVVHGTAVVGYAALTLQDPARLVLTFPGAVLGDVSRPIPDAGVVRGVLS